MSLADGFRELLSDEPATFDQFSTYLDAEWIQKALVAVGKVTVRRRSLPAHLVLWLVVGMGLFRNLSIAEVAEHLKVSRVGVGRSRKRSVAPSSISEARDRLGPEPVEWLFKETGKLWADVSAQGNVWRGLSLFATDGTTLRVPDSDENRGTFGLPGAGRGQAAYPQVRAVALMAVRSHVLAGAAIGPCRGKKTGEQTLAKSLWAQLPNQSLTIVDKGFVNYARLYALHAAGKDRHWLIRAKQGLQWTIVRELGHGDYWVEVTIPHSSRKEDPSLPKSFICRAISYQIDNGPLQWVLTSLLDVNQYPALDVVTVYHERWEIELGYDEIKTHMLEREETLRSRKPEKVRQEIWGILLAYNLVRVKMMDVADKTGMPPTRLSFTHSLRLIRLFCEIHAWAAAPTKLPRRIEDLENMMALLILPPRRSERSYPRHVKIKMSSYKRNPGRPEKKVS